MTMPLATHHGRNQAILLHLLVILVLFGLQFVLPDYHHVTLARILVLATYAVGYNIAFGYTGLLSLGHAMFFAAGMYGAGLTAHHLGWGTGSAFLAGLACGLGLAVLVGLLALRTAGVSFMIVTLMFAQAAYLVILYFNEYTRGDEGFNLRGEARGFTMGPVSLDFTDPVVRYNLALGLFALALAGSYALMRSSAGRVLVAIRENEERARMLGYDVFRRKLFALAVSGLISAAAGAAYGLLFAYVGATFSTIQYSILPLLWVLLGGAGTILGPLVGTVFMFYLEDITSEFTSAYLLIVGIALVLLVLWAPKGIMGTLRDKRLKWLP